MVQREETADMILEPTLENGGDSDVSVRSKTLSLQSDKSKECGEILLVGSERRVAQVIAELQRNHPRLKVLGYLDIVPPEKNKAFNGTPFLGSVADITTVLKNHVVDEVVIAVSPTLFPAVHPVVRACQEEGIVFSFPMELFKVDDSARVQLQYCGQIPLLTYVPIARPRWKLRIKRGLDVLLSLFSLIFVAPLMVLIALAIKANSPGPIFFRQERVGFRKRRFHMLKFRSMVHNAEQLQAQVEHLNEAEGPIFKIANDPRLTRVGRFLRRSSLDELPQLIHVLKGEMSMVGPRPMSVRDVDLFDQGIQRRRFSVKPGLTCLWQISGRSNLPFSKWLELDLQYIREWSLWLDWKILFKTLPAVLRKNGAV